MKSIKLIKVFVLAAFMITAGSVSADGFVNDSVSEKSIFTPELSDKTEDDEPDPFLDFFPVIIGQPNDMRPSPFYFNWDYSLSQSIYIAREVGLGGGYLTGIQYRIWFEEASPQTRIKIWIGETEQTDLTQDWADASAFQLVFDKVIDFPEGEFDIFFPFDEPYHFQGGNLVVHAWKSGEAVQGKNLFFSQVISGSARTRSLEQGTTAGPIALPQQDGALLNEIPFVVMFFSWDGLRPLAVDTRGTGRQEDEVEHTQSKDASARMQTSTSNPDGLQITEFIFNETISKLGADFYHYFFQQWQNPSGVEGLSIHVQERPVPGMGALVMIKVEEQLVYQGMLRPNVQMIRDAVKAAVQRTQAYFTNYEMIRQQLESDDMRGTGIY
jgi:hypothetical protein